MSSSKQILSSSGEPFKIFISGAIYPNGVELLEKFFGAENIEQWKSSEHCPYELLLQKSRECDAIVTHITDRVDDQILSSPRLKIVSQCAVGLDNIDLKSATEHKIVVANTPEVLTDACADLAWALIMAVARNVIESNRFVYSGEWKTFDQMQFLGLDVFGTTIGIVGPGRIGQAVARRAVGFNMRILYTGHSPKDYMNNLGGTFVSMEELLSESDYVVLTCNLCEQTKGLIGKKELSLMKDTGVLINIARGKVVDSDALVKALENHTIAAAGLDVFDPEPIPLNHPILKLKNVTLTSHIAGANITTRKRMASLTAHAIIDCLQGRKVQYLANKDLVF